MSSYQIVERGSNHRVHERIERKVDSDGKVHEVKHSYTELATGLCYHDSQNGPWMDADPEIVVDATGKGLARHAQHSIQFQPNINTSGAINVTTPTGHHLRSHVLAIYLHDWKTDQSVQIAGLHDSIGTIVGKNQVIYKNSLTGNGSSADVRYTFKKAGMSQDIIFHELIAPANLPANEEDLEIEIWTEFLEFPQPTKHAQADKVTGFSNDAILDFGDMRIGQGTAFSSGDESQRRRGTPVKKEWITIQGRTFLIESIPYKSVRAEVDNLPPHAAANSSSLRNMAFSHGRNPPSALKVKDGESETMQVASSAFSEKGFVVDYETKFGGATDFTFQGDTTYYISDSFFLSGQTTIEGGTVVKSSVSGGEGFAVDWDGSIVCKTAPYRPAVFTSKNDNSVGEFISGSTGTPASSDVLIALSIGIEYPDLHLNNLRASYADTAFQFGTAEPGTGRLTDIQINDCGTAFTFGGSVYFGNILAHEVWTVFDVTPNSEVLVEHLTVAIGGADCVLHTGEIGSNGSFFIRNSIFAGIYDLGTSVGGSENGFYHSPIFGSPYWNVTSSPFATAGGGHCYLAIDVYGSDASGFRDKGTTTIDAGLLDSLKKKTTYAPIEITANVTSDTVWSPQVSRDSDLPDLGYHYDPIDYTVGGITVEAQLTLTAGTVVASHGSNAGLLVDGGILTASGTANNPVQMIRYNCVQEESGGSWAANSSYAQVLVDNISSAETDFNFTYWSTLAGNVGQFSDWFSNGNHVFRNCQFAGGGLDFEDAYANFFNCLFNRTHLLFWQESFAEDWSNNSLINSTMIGGSLSIYLDSTDINITDSLFDRTGIYAEQISGQFNHSHNGYVQGYDRILSSATGDVNLTSTGYLTGPYGGRFYYPSSGGSGSLYALVNAGSRSASDAGLDTGYTVFLNQAPDENDVDIGFHYAALQAPVAYGDNAPPVCAYPDNVQIIMSGWDPQNFSLTFVKVTNPNHGTLGTFVQGDGTATTIYTPNSGFCGYDSFTFKVNNGYMDSASATINITVGDPYPVANCRDVRTGKNTPVSIILSGSDTCGDALTFTVSGSGPSPGSLGMITQIDTTHASVTYTPGSSTFEGTDGFDFIASNCGFSSQPTHVTVNVAVPAPVLAADCREDRIFLSWTIPEWVTAAGLADTFQIYRCDTSSGSCMPVTVYDTMDGSGSAYLDTDVVANMNYCYRVTFQHQDCDGSTMYESPFSNVACSSICPAPPNTNCVIRSGFNTEELQRNDDQSTDLINLPFNINFYGTTYSNFYINNNANVTFSTSLLKFTPDSLQELNIDIIAPFWADVDTRNLDSDLVQYGTGTVGGRSAIGINWVNVGYYLDHADKLLSVQLIFIDRSDTGAGNFDMEFNYCRVRWEAGDASSGVGGFWLGPDGKSARAGFASPNSTAGFELNGSAVPGAFLDSNTSTGLIYHSFNSTAAGQYIFQFRTGSPLQTP